jgi:hypothetical protein
MPELKFYMSDKRDDASFIIMFTVSEMPAALKVLYYLLSEKIIEPQEGVNDILEQIRRFVEWIKTKLFTATTAKNNFIPASWLTGLAGLEAEPMPEWNTIFTSNAFRWQVSVPICVNISPRLWRKEVYDGKRRQAER